MCFSPAISVFSEKINTDTKASAALRKQDGSFFETRFSYNLDYDLRNRSYRPTDGTRSVFSQGIPLMSENYALSNAYEITKWHQFDNKMVSDLGFFVKAINSVTGEDVKISKRVNLPLRRLRGFEKGMVGPVDGTDYVGGNYAMSLNFNSTLPMILPNLENVDVKYFLDFANLWGVDYSNTVDESNTIRSSTGLAINWFTPIGPLNFSLSQNLLKAKTDVTELFQFNLGTTF